MVGEIAKWYIMKKGVSEQIVKFVEEMYNGAIGTVRTVCRYQ